MVDEFEHVTGFPGAISFGERDRAEDSLFGERGDGLVHRLLRAAQDLRMTACSMAATLPRTDRAVSSRVSDSAASARARRRWDRTSPSIREEATDSARSRRRASTSRLANSGGSRFRASMARSAEESTAATL